MGELAREVRKPIRGKWLLIALGIVLVIAVIPSVIVPALVKDPELPDRGNVPAFSLVDQTGATFTEDALRGHPTIVSVIFTRCDTTCPVIAAKTRALQERTQDRKGIAIKLLSISIDPTYDTPARLAEFAAKYQADPARWRFLTGPEPTIRELVTNTFMHSMDREGNTPSGAPNIVHQGYFLLVDANLVIRGVYDSNDINKLDELVRHARFLARTASDRGYKFGGG